MGERRDRPDPLFLGQAVQVMSILASRLKVPAKAGGAE
jgi:hypothetical protein